MENNDRILELFENSTYHTEQEYYKDPNFRNNILYNDPDNIYAIGRDSNNNQDLLNGINAADDNLNTLTGKLAAEIDQHLDQHLDQDADSIERLRFHRQYRKQQQVAFTKEMILKAQRIRVFADKTFLNLIDQGEELGKGALAREVQLIIVSDNFNYIKNDAIFTRIDGQ